MKLPALPAALLALTFAIAAGPAAGAADDSPNPSAESGQALDPAPDDRELTDFVNAFMRLVGVQHGYMMLMQHEPDPVRVEELRASAIADMEAAIKQDGLTVDRYNAIALAVRDDDALQERVESILQQLAADPSTVQ